MPALLGVDVGGTFTDVVVVEGGRVVTAKVPTTAADQSEGVMGGVHAALASAGLDAGDVGELAHGTTAATNALLERRGARTGFVATRGFGDLLTLGRQARPHLYRLCHAPPAPLAGVTAELDERMGPDGPLRALSRGSVEQAARRLRRAGVEAVAVCLLHSYADDRHERAAAELLRRLLPEAFVVASCELAPEFREFERASTTVADAYLGPPAGRYLARLAGRAREGGLPSPLVMQSSGGVCDVGEAAAHPARLLLSGPAGGVAAVASEHRDAISFDMGGTSCDVCLVREGRPGRSAERTVGGLAIRLPMVDVHTVGAGGGSVAWLDAGGALRVGPRSAGADPGPACYGRGGSEPTVTDANVVLGRLDPAGELAGGIRLDREAASRALERVAGPFDGVEEAARGVVEVAIAEMARAVRVVSVERGHDPRDFELVAFGGAGPLHACAVADALGMHRVAVPAHSGVLSALGIAAGERRRDAVRAVMRPLAAVSTREWGALVPDPGGAGELEAVAELRYRGQAFELSVPLEPAATLAARFHERHEERYGFAEPGAEVEVVNVRASRTAPGPGLERAASAPGRAVEGPASIPLDGATLWVAEGWTARSGPDGSWSLER